MPGLDPPRRTAAGAALAVIAPRRQVYAGNRPIPMPHALKRQLPVAAAGRGEHEGCGSGCSH
jgi:hypothetical protein